LATSSRKSRRIPLKSIRFRLAALFVGIFTFALSILSILVYSQFSNSRAIEFDRSLYNYAVDVAHGINVGAFGDLSYDIDSFLGVGKSFPFAVGRSFIQLSRMDGTLIGKSRDLGTDSLPLGPDELRGVTQNRYTFLSVPPEKFPVALKGNQTRYRQINLVVNPGIKSTFVLQIAVPLTFLEKERQNLLGLFYIAIPIAVLISMLGGIYLSGRAFVPIQLIIEKAKSFDPKILNERLPVPPVDDELKALSVTLNELLDRIQKMFMSQERFVADASHQLKTPLSILRGELDISMKKERSPAETRILMTSMSQELLHLSKIIDDLLLLARVDAGVAFLTKTPVRVDEITLDAISKLEGLARQKDITLKMNLSGNEKAESSFTVSGDQYLLSSMIGELIGNAIKYSPNGKSVEVSIIEENDYYKIDVQDYGQGVPEKDRDKIFERFYRAPGRQPDVTGSGLGLSIAKQIAEIHGGDITYQNRGDGSTFTIRIKKV